jgi:hypothetical protein
MFLTPHSLISFELRIAIAEIMDALMPPMNDSTAGVESSLSTNAVCITPHAYVLPTAHHVSVAQEATMTHP